MNNLRNSDPMHDFSHEHYTEILTKIKTSHKTFSFKDAHELGEKILDVPCFVIMRHDVEVSLDAALALAKIDASQGIRSTFFLLQTGNYNPFHFHGRNCVKQILDLGHDIGLHYDMSFLNDDAEAEKILLKQVELFECFFNTKVYAMSSHMPMRSGKVTSVRDVLNVYDPLYLTKIKYISDSTQAWRENVISDLLDTYDQIHFLAHEYIWDEHSRDWSTLLLLDVKNKMDILWEEAVNDIDRFRLGLKLREQKDKEFKEKFF